MSLKFRKLLISIACVAIALCGSTSFASSEEFIDAGLSIPRALQARGYTQFGSLNLETFVSQMNSVRIEFSKDKSIAKKNQNGRISARWETTARGSSIRVYTPSWQRFTDQRPILALHEYLGVFGFYDDNYWLSTQMWTLSLNATDSLTAGERARIERSIEAHASRREQHASNGGGGVIGVGGGGEGATIWLRQNSIRERLNELNSGEGERSEAVSNIYRELESTSEAGYAGYESPAAIRAARIKAATYKPYCLVSLNRLCKTKSKSGQSEPCTCPGIDYVGTVVFTATPW